MWYMYAISKSLVKLTELGTNWDVACLSLAKYPNLISWLPLSQNFQYSRVKVMLNIAFVLAAHAPCHGSLYEHVPSYQSGLRPRI